MNKIFALMLTCILVCVCTTGCVDIPTDAPNSSAVSQKDTTTTTSSTTTTKITTTAKAPTQTVMVWIPQSGTKYHSKASCSNMKNPR